MGKLKTENKGIKTNSILLNSQIHHTKSTITDHRGKVKIGTTTALTVQGGEQAPIADPDERPGWLFIKAIADTAKFNYFFYGEGNTAITLDDLTSIYSNVTIDNYQGPNSLPFFVVYTKLTGVGDAGAWYHSKILYTLTTNEKILLGEPIQLYSGSKPNNNTHIRQVECNVKTVTGDGAGDEEIYTITIHSDSGSPAATQILVSSVGIDLYNGIDKISKNTILV